jgi:hypothetical protein
MSGDFPTPVPHDVHVVFAQYAAVEPGTGAITVVRGWLSKFWPDNGAFPINTTGYVILDFPVHRLTSDDAYPLTISLHRLDGQEPTQELGVGEFSFEKRKRNMVVGQLAFPIAFKLSDYGRYQIRVALGNPGEQLTGALDLDVEERGS